MEELIDCSGGDEVNLETGTARKLQALRSTLAAHGAQRVVVFCNKIETCRVVENGLKRAEKDERRYEVSKATARSNNTAMHNALPW